MSVCYRTIGNLLLIAVSLPWNHVAAQGSVTAAQVQRAIKGGIQYLRSTQQDDGRWPEYAGQTGGMSSLCTLALINSGVPVDDPAIKKALRYLRSLDPNETYSVALQTLVLCEVGSAADLGIINRNVRWLEDSQLPRGDWTYRSSSSLGIGDPSNAQFAVLALGAAEQRGVRVQPEVMQRAHRYWAQTQRNDGGWSYEGGGATRGSMTCAGIASLVICQGFLSHGDARIEGDFVLCCGSTSQEEDPIERGIQWLAKRFSVETHPGSQSGFSQFYYLYALERVGRMTGRRMIGDHDWYRAGAEFLVRVQDPFQNRWRGRGFGETDPNVTTSFALLFLAKGKRQVVLGRLQHGTEEQAEPWQQHPGGPQQLVRHVERAWGRDLTWQTIRMGTATSEDLLQAPVLLVSGSGALDWDADRRATLKAYVDQGGCILFEANAGRGCGDATAFERSVQQICSDWYPNSPIERLPPEHPVWFAEGRVLPARLGEKYWLYGVQACCRTAVFYSPQSLACRWEVSDPTGQREIASAAVRAETAAALQLGQNIIAYATGRELKEKLETKSILLDEIDSGQPRNVLQVPRLDLQAGSEDARRALPNLLRWLQQKFPVRVGLVEEDVPLVATELEPYPILWIHGRTAFELDETQRKELRVFVENGGIVLADSICGSEAFAKAFREQWLAVFPDSPLQPMPADHPAFTAQFGHDLSAVTLRQPTVGPTGVSINQRASAPVIESATRDGFHVAFLSPYDLSCALESPNSIQCPGYATADAAKIGINLILYAMQQ